MRRGTRRRRRRRPGARASPDRGRSGVRARCGCGRPRRRRRRARGVGVEPTPGEVTRAPAETAGVARGAVRRPAPAVSAWPRPRSRAASRRLRPSRRFSRALARALLGGSSGSSSALASSSSARRSSVLALSSLHLGGPGLGLHAVGLVAPRPRVAASRAPDRPRGGDAPRASGLGRSLGRIFPECAVAKSGARPSWWRSRPARRARPAGRTT